MIEGHRLKSADRHSDSTRLVWYVAVCGYVLVNGVAFLHAVLPVVTPSRLAALLVPWALTAILSIAGHIAIIRAARQEDRYHLGVLGSLDVFAFKVADGKADGSDLRSIINDTDPKLRPEKAAVDSANQWRHRLVQTAQWALLGSFVWSMVALIFAECLLPKS